MDNVKKTLLETDEHFTFIKSEVCNGIYFEIYNDDYGMSYHIAWVDPETKKVDSWCCGTCNDYEYDLKDISRHLQKKLALAMLVEENNKYKDFIQLLINKPFITEKDLSLFKCDSNGDYYYEEVEWEETWDYDFNDELYQTCLPTYKEYYLTKNEYNLISDIKNITAIEFKKEV